MIYQIRNPESRSHKIINKTRNERKTTVSKEIRHVAIGERQRCPYKWIGRIQQFVYWITKIKCEIVGGIKPQNSVDTWSSHSQALFRRIPWVITKTDNGSVQGNAFLGDVELHEWRTATLPSIYSTKEQNTKLPEKGKVEMLLH